METEFLQLIPCDYTLEVICYEVRGNELAEVVSAHKVVILPVEIFTEQSGVMLLKDFSLPKHILDVRNQRKGYTKYFSEGIKAKEITETIEKALAFYFENMEEN